MPDKNPPVSEPLKVPDETDLFFGQLLPFVHPAPDPSGLLRVEAIGDQDPLEHPRVPPLLGLNRLDLALNPGIQNSEQHLEFLNP